MEINIVHHSDCLIFIFFSFGYLERFEIWEIKEGVSGKNKATSFIAAKQEEESTKSDQYYNNYFVQLNCFHGCFLHFLCL